MEIYELEVHSYGGVNIYRVGENGIELIKEIYCTRTGIFGGYCILYRDKTIVKLKGNFNFIEKSKDV